FSFRITRSSQRSAYSQKSLPPPPNGARVLLPVCSLPPNGAPIFFSVCPLHEMEGGFLRRFVRSTKLEHRATVLCIPDPRRNTFPQNFRPGFNHLETGNPESVRTLVFAPKM